MTRSLRPATLLVHGATRRSQFEETSEALFLTSGYVYRTAEEAEQAFTGGLDRYVYSRYGNPTVTMFEERLALLEGAECGTATSSGMAAVFAALMCQLKAGDRVVASLALFGACHFVIDQILPRYGIAREFVDGTDIEAWRKALAKPTVCVFLETPSNPTLKVIDLPAVAQIAHAAGARVVVDNAFATPILQHPLTLGADVVVYSATKHIDGQGRCLGGIVLSDKTFRGQLLQPFYRNTGPALSPFNAWVLLKGLETLPIRVERAAAGALKVAMALERLPVVKQVLYPGLPSHPQHELVLRQMAGGGTVLAFEVDGGRERAFRFMNALKVICISNNLGDAKSLITHPATTTHQKLSADEQAAMGIRPGLVRLSVGLEDADDLIEDLAQALAV